MRLMPLLQGVRKLSLAQAVIDLTTSAARRNSVAHGRRSIPVQH